MVLRYKISRPNKSAGKIQAGITLCQLNKNSFGCAFDATKEDVANLVIKAVIEKDKNSIAKLKAAGSQTGTQAFFSIMRGVLGSMIDVDMSICQNFAPLLSTGSENGDKSTRIYLSRNFGYAAYALEKKNWGTVAMRKLKEFGLPLEGSVNQKDILYGDAAFELFKVQGVLTENKFKPEKIVCAARFDTDIKVCTTCCCKAGLMGSSVSSILLQNTSSPCSEALKKASPRLCRSPILLAGESTGSQGIGALGTNPIMAVLNDQPGQYPQCAEWFTALDSTLRFYNQIGTAFATNAFHGGTRKAFCERKGNRELCEKTPFVAGGTGCMSTQ